MPLPNERTYTIEDIFALPEGERAELIDGQLYMMSPPNYKHQKLVSKFTRIIGNYIDSNGGPCEVLPAPLAVRLNEIVSPGTQRRDYGIKLFKYRTAGVREYWIVNPAKEIVNAYCFENEENSNLYSFTDDIPVGIYPGFSINIAELLK